MQFWLPSGDYAKDVWVRSRELKNKIGLSRQEYQRLRMASITGKRWRADHSFKLLK